MSEIRPDISIIIPVYNVEKYIVRCLDSIFKQQFSGTYEVIAVEDCSTDNSLQLLKKYQENEVRLKIIEHCVNKKVSLARSTGLKYAKGDYIMFVDSDDWIMPNALKDLHEKCVKSEADVIVFNYLNVDNLGNSILINKIKKQFTTTDKNKVYIHFFGALWNKIFKRTLIENLVSGQVELSITEDLLYGTEILIKAETICLIPEHYYVYYINVNSLTQLVTSDYYLKNQIIVLNQIQIMSEKYNISSQLTNYLMNYFEKWIYLELAKLHFWKNEDLPKSTKLINELFKFPIMTPYRINRLKLSIRFKYINLIEVTRRFGLRLTLGIIKKSLNK